MGTDGVQLTVLSRNPPGLPPIPHATILPGDLRDPQSLSAALRGIDRVIHAASYIGSDPRLAEEVNRQGTRNLLDECRRQGITKVTYLSTTSVYGSGPHRGLSERQATYGARSAASATRAEADRMVLEAGGVTVRPNLVFGEGDRWFIPGLAKMMRAGTWPGDGSALLSLIDVETLGAMVAWLALSGGHPGTAFHAVGSEPVSVARLLAATAAGLGIPVPHFTRGAGARDTLLRAGFTGHQVDLVTVDHWYSGHVFRGIPGPGFSEDALPVEGQWEWYRNFLRGSGR